jgi:hypothetical protein
MSNVELFGRLGVVSASDSPVSSVSNSLFFPDGVGDGVSRAGGLRLPPNGVLPSATAAMAALRGELESVERFVTDLAPEVTLRPGAGLPTQQGIENVGVFEMNIDPNDTNGDGIAVIDILIDNGNSDFKLTNSNWIIESARGTFAIFRIRGGSNLVLNQSSILVGDGIVGNGGNPAAGMGPAVTHLGAIFVKAGSYSNGAGGRNTGESLQSGDTVFSFNDTVVNGVGFYDLIAFRNNAAASRDNGKTELKINNGQGCAQFVSPKINFNNVRFERCALPKGGDAQHKNIADAAAVSATVVVASDDVAHWVVSGR